MSKFRKHVVAEAIEETNQRDATASALYPRHSDAWFAEYNTLYIENMAKYGLWDCYKDVRSMLWDFYADNFTWSQRMTRQCELMLTDPRWKDRVVTASATIKQDWDFDFCQDLELASKTDRSSGTSMD